MSNIPELLKAVLRGYFYVEWFEAHKLFEEIRAGSTGFDVEKFKAQFKELISAQRIPLEEINKITGEEFETEQEARNWLRETFVQVFGESV